MSRRLVFVLLLLPALAAASPKKSARVLPRLPWDQLDGVVAEWEKSREKIEPLLVKLRALGPEYGEPADAKDLAARRASLRGQLQPLSTKVADVRDRFREMQKAIQLQALPLAFASVNASNFQEASGKEMLKALRYEEVYKDMVDYSRNLREAMLQDQIMFDVAENARKDRRRVTKISVAAGAAGVIILALFLWGLRSQAQVTVAPLPASLLSGPAGTPLSGPGTPVALSEPVGNPLLLPAPGRAQAPPELLGGNFQIVREIGQGGMGIVYEALDLTLQRKVAIKKMRAEVTRSKRELEMFLVEARLVASLKHPNLVEIYSIVREGEQLFLIFEFVSGKPLHQSLEDGVGLPHAQIKSILGPVAQALDYAHSKRIIHRDLKPSNIMITDDGAVKVMDFGIAHQAKKTVAKVTQADAWGTPPYMAPEQELGTVSRESDLFSLGVCYYEMLTGQLPFPGPNYLAQKREMAYDAPTKTGPRLHPKTDEIIGRALQVDPRRRFHSGAEFAAAVESVP